jgi:2-C-methyl-D-erythritol 4-phosphate cytidylyltransferase
MKHYALIVAGGSGTRMGSTIPKQFLLLCGKPVLMHTLEQFYKADNNTQIIVVLPASQSEYWKELCKQFSFTIPHQVTIGGDTRFHSVTNGLNLVPDYCLVAIHDGVRPLVTAALIHTCFEAASKNGCAIPAIPVHESLRRKNGDVYEQVDRSDFYLVQTPQCFNAGMLKKAYAAATSSHYTDDASVFEAGGHTIYLIDGIKENIKITTPADLTMAEGYLKLLSL